MGVKLIRSSTKEIPPALTQIKVGDNFMRNINDAGNEFRCFWSSIGIFSVSWQVTRRSGKTRSQKPVRTISKDGINYD